MLSPRSLSDLERLTLMQGLLIAAERLEEAAKVSGYLGAGPEFTAQDRARVIAFMQVQAISTRTLHNLCEHAATITIAPDLHTPSTSAPPPRLHAADQ